MRIKLFEEFINESVRNPLVDSILSALENTILDMVNRAEKYYSGQGMEFTPYDRELVRLNIIYDMLRSIESYTLPTDSLLEINARTSAKGNIEISANIEREGLRYYLNTEAIIAGGHNIQRIHYRYITKTSLPKTGQSEISQSYAAKIKKMSKLEKLNDEIKNWEVRIKKNEEDIAWAVTLTDDEVLKKYRSGENPMRKVFKDDPSWEEMVKNGADKNYNFDKNQYETAMADYRKSNIEFWKRVNITWKEQDIVTGLKEIAKLRKKIEAAI
jgi:hypothetical protein